MVTKLVDSHKYVETGNLKKKLAYEAESKGNIEEAIKLYKSARENFDKIARNDSTYLEDSRFCNLKVADLTCEFLDIFEAEEEKISLAIRLYDKLKVEYNDDIPIRNSIAFKIICLHLAIHPIEVARKLKEKFIEEHPDLVDEPEWRFLNETISCYSTANDEKFKEECARLNKYSYLTTWQINIFTRIKNSILRSSKK